MPPRILLALAGLAFGTRSAHAVSWTYRHESAMDFEEAFSELGARAMERFDKADTNGDGYVTYWELSKSFGLTEHLRMSGGDWHLRRMMAECSGQKDHFKGSDTCNRANMTESLQLWQKSSVARSEFRLWQADHGSGFLANDNQAGMLRAELQCGKRANLTEEGLHCEIQGVSCFVHGPWLAWALDEVCTERACVCTPTKTTKRLTKVGLAGAIAVMTSADLSNPSDPPLMPACGEFWSATPVVGTVTQLNSLISEKEMNLVEKTAAVWYKAHDTRANIRMADTLDTEAVLFKSGRHRVKPNDPYRSVCMISWQSSRSGGDLKADFLREPMNFAWGGKADLQVPRGYGLAYESIRARLKETFDRECCTLEFMADHLIISGHGRGGALAELNAMDAVNNWECPEGRDLTGKHIALIMAGPPRSLLPMSALNNIFSCSQESNCLAGSVVTINSRLDPVSDQKTKTFQGQPPRHPAAVIQLPCTTYPKYAKFYKRNEKETMRDWCHSMVNYMPMVEEFLVDIAGWGSSCAGTCGDMNRHFQCAQYTSITGKPCSTMEANATIPMCGANSWKVDREKCTCPFTPCDQLTGLGCEV